MAFFQTDNLRVEQQSEGMALLWLDVAGRPFNVFTRPVLSDLDHALDQVAADANLRFLIIRSAKTSGFLAGADLHEFTVVRSADDAQALSALGQRLFDKLERLAMPTLAVIHGPCLGGGLELALACDYRLTVDVPGTQLGFPEIELGLLPGWGGTQRLPRVIGLERALQVILGSRRLGARDALLWGLADTLATEADLPAQLEQLTQRALRQGKRPQTKLPLLTWRQRLLESTRVGRGLLFRGAERVLHRRVPEDMPAPWEALQAIGKGMTEGTQAGLAFEREAIGRLALTPACRNLVTLFFQREKARKLPEDERDIASSIRRVGIVGAGTMGAGIAQLAALKGHEVVIQEVSEEALGAGLIKVAALFEKAVERRLLTREDAQRKLAAIKGTTTWIGFDNVDVVVEAALEELQAKRAIFKELERSTLATAILATNTSSLLVHRLQEGLVHPERVGGLHFFNPVHKMPLVEVVRAPATSDKISAVLASWAIALGKTPVVVRDSPGFVVNRILMPYLNEAILLVAGGMAIEQVDRIMRRFGMPLGPLELIDQVGIDVAAHIAVAMQPAFGSRFAPNLVFERMCSHGWLGAKNGLGFYRYRGKRKHAFDTALGVVRDRQGSAPVTVPTEEARERMVLLMVNEAAACLGAELAGSADDIDLAMVLGTGWAPHRGGPLRYASDRGYAEVVKILSDLERRLGSRFEPCAELRRRAADEREQL